jgi:signal transduction histidine kinase
MWTGHNRLSLQIVTSLFLVFGLGFAFLILAGYNAIRMVDDRAMARQERIATHTLAAAIATIPEQQQSATVWDDAIEKTAARDESWMDENLGAWMQDYFGHNENYVLDQDGTPIFASVMGEILSPDRYSTRADQIAPVIAQLREMMAEASEGQDNPYEELAEVAVVTPLRFGGEVSIVSVAPIISDTGDVAQAPGTEWLHVAVRYVNEEFAQAIGQPIELDDVAFQTTHPTGAQAGIPLAGLSGNVHSWLAWKPEKPGMTLLLEILPILLAVLLATATLILWIVQRLLGISGRLQASEAQAHLDVVALEKAREAADASNHAKMKFMSVVSHELRTPLTVILGYARLGAQLRKMPSAQLLDEQLHRQPVNIKRLQSSVDELLKTATTGMEKVERSGEHLLFLVNQLLDYAKMETGRLVVDPVICDVREVIEPVLDQMRILTEEKDLDLEITIAPCFMLADVTRTRQILINLMGNAIKFTDSGKVSVVVTESEDRVHIDVSDTGIGIEPHELENIFEAFHQAELSFSRSAAGTGLGLSVAKELARLEGGALEVRSEVGVGSTFTLTLPKQASPILEKAA